VSSPRPAAEAGFSLVQVVAVTAVMLILMSVGMPTWRYVMKDAREEELIFRGGQIADAVARYQKKNGNALPVSLDVLVRGKFLRKAYKDPMTKDGKWRFVRAGELQTPAAGGPRPGGPAPVPSGAPGRPEGSPGQPEDTASPAPSPRPSPGTPGGDSPGGLGGFIGVASTSTDKSLRIFNGKTRYNEWVFAAGQKRVVGNTPLTPLNPGEAPGAPQGGGVPVPGPAPTVPPGGPSLPGNQ
jgi:type II secretory pathway pseudopilin PulG